MATRRPKGATFIADTRPEMLGLNPAPSISCELGDYGFAD
jgi:hypothetical protein